MTLISALPTVPSRSSGFSAAEAEAFLEALPDFVTETNATLAYFDLRNADASAVTMWAAGDYTKGAVVWSPLTGTNYRAKNTHTSATDPSLDTTNWSAASGVSGSDQAKLDLITITEAKNLDAVLTRPVRTADGAISKGDVLVRQSDGTVAAVTSSVGGPTTGSNAVFNAGASNPRKGGIAADPSTGKFLIVYTDAANSNYGTAVVATVTGTSVSFGTPVVFEAASTSISNIVVAFDPVNSKFLIAYTDGGNSNYITAIVCTVSGTTPSFGSAVTNSVAGFEKHLSYDVANAKFLLTYDNGSGLPQGVVISISGTTPSFGTAAQATATFGTSLGLKYDATAGKHLLIQGRSAGLFGFLATISGTSVSWGSAQTLPAVDGYQETGQLAGPNAGGKFLFVYENGSDAGNAYSVVLTVSGSTVTAGTPVEFNDSQSTVLVCEYFDDDDEFWVLFTDADNSDYLTSTTITVSGTVPSASAFTVIRSSNPSFYQASHFDPTSGVALVAYRDVANSNYGTAFAHTPSTITTDADSWLAIAAAAAADTEDVQLLTVGDIVDGLSGLTYGTDVYVDVDGSLTHSITAYGKIGFALSATELLITETN